MLFERFIQRTDPSINDPALSQNLTHHSSQNCCTPFLISQLQWNYLFKKSWFLSIQCIMCFIITKRQHSALLNITYRASRQQVLHYAAHWNSCDQCLNRKDIYVHNPELLLTISTTDCSRLCPVVWPLVFCGQGQLYGVGSGGIHYQKL